MRVMNAPERPEWLQAQADRLAGAQTAGQKRGANAQNALGAPRAFHSNAPRRERFGDPGDHLVEHVPEPGRSLETEHPAGLVDGRNPPENVMLERRVVLEP